MGLSEYELICAQKHPEFIDECINLLNSEWPRSKTARLVSIQQGSSEGFPTTLLLIDRNKTSLHQGVVVAHCKVSPVSVYYQDSCFVESVVVSKDLRGKGIGRIIMDKMESYVKCRGIRTLYLTTHDQQGFYEKMGYSFCDPVVIYGGKFGSTFGSIKTSPLNSSSNKTQQEMHGEEDSLSLPMEKISLQACDGGTDDNNAKNKDNNVPLAPPPPLPPPLPIVSKNCSTKTKLTKNDIVLTPNLIKVTMKKELF